jgi:hypothetical protein
MRSRWIPALLALQMAALGANIALRPNQHTAEDRLPASFTGWPAPDFLWPHGKLAD